MCRSGEPPLDLVNRALGSLLGWAAEQPADAQGGIIVEYYQLVARLQAAITQATRRFEQSGAFKADGALGMVPWLQANARLAGNEAAQQVKVARHLGELPRTEEALARGEIGYGHAVAMAVTAEHVGVEAVRRAEETLLEAAEGMDAGRFVTAAKHFEHQVNAEAALTEANWAYRHRYLVISRPFNGHARIEGQLTPEAAAVIRSAMEPFLKPAARDDRTASQRAHDALVEVCQRTGNGSAPRPQLIITTSADTLAALRGAAAGELEFGGTLPAETVRRLACDAAISRVISLGELHYETTRASRTVPPALRRALIARDGHCVFPSCDRGPSWCAGHHLKFWADGGETTIENLCLLCQAHHRKLHEEGWTLSRENGTWVARPPGSRMPAASGRQWHQIATARPRTAVARL